MARFVLIFAIALWGVCGGYGILDRILESKKYPTEYTTEYPTEYPTEPTDYTQIYTETDTDEQYPEANDGPAVSQKIQFRCPRDYGLFGYPQDCTRFIQCSHGHAYIMPCPQGLHFSVRANRCDYPCEAQCNPAISDVCRGKKPDAVCTLPVEKGKCHGALTRYYYDIWERKCKTFVFGGCHGNGNNFKSQKHCMEVCGKVVAHGTNTQDSSASYPPVDSYDYDRETINSYTTWETTSDDINTRQYPVWDEMEKTEDYLSLSTYDAPRNLEEDPWGPYTPGDSETARDITWDSKSAKDISWNFESAKDITWDSNLPREELSSELPGFSIESSSTPMDDFECSRPGAFRNPDDCGSFILCLEDNRAFLAFCPADTEFSEQREECVDPCEAHCNTSLACQCGWPECHQYNLIDCESDPDVGPCKAQMPRYYYDRESGRCKKFYYGGCLGNGNNFRTLRECQKECKTNLLAGFRCPSHNGDFGHYPDCVTYYQCKRGIPTLKRCPEGKAFHHLKSKCVPEEEAMCVYECREPDAVYPAPKDCRSYIDCVNSIPKLKKCPRGLAFDANKKNCVLERNASCHW